jgi:hypothetical protein
MISLQDEDLVSANDTLASEYIVLEVPDHRINKGTEHR